MFAAKCSESLALDYGRRRNATHSATGIDSELMSLSRTSSGPGRLGIVLQAEWRYSLSQARSHALLGQAFLLSASPFRLRLAHLPLHWLARHARRQHPAQRALGRLDCLGRVGPQLTGRLNEPLELLRVVRPNSMSRGLPLR